MPGCARVARWMSERSHAKRSRERKRRRRRRGRADVQDERRAAYNPNDYDKVILPLLVARRLDCVLGPTKHKVLTRLDALKDKGMKASYPAVDVALRKITGAPFYNTSKVDFAKRKGDPNHVVQNLRGYLKLVRRIYDETQGGKSEAAGRP